MCAQHYAHFAIFLYVSFLLHTCGFFFPPLALSLSPADVVRLESWGQELICWRLRHCHCRLAVLVFFFLRQLQLFVWNELHFHIQTFGSNSQPTKLNKKHNLLSIFLFLTLVVIFWKPLAFAFCYLKTQSKLPGKDWSVFSKPLQLYQ